MGEHNVLRILWTTFMLSVHSTDTWSNSHFYRHACLWTELQKINTNFQFDNIQPKGEVLHVQI